MPDVASIYRQVRVMGIPRGEPMPNGHSNGSVDLSDPVEQAMVRRRALLATRMEEDTANQLTSQAELDRRRLEIEEAKLELEQESLRAKLTALRSEREKLNGNGNGHADANMQALIALMAEQNQRALSESKEKSDALLALLNEQLEDQRQRNSRPETPSSVSVAERMRELGELRQVISQLFPAPTPQQGMPAHQMIEMRKMELDLEYQRHKLAEESAERVRRLAFEEKRLAQEHGLREAQVRVEQERNARMAGLIEQIGPVAVQALAQRFMGGGEGQGGPQPQGPPPSLEQHLPVKCVGCAGDFFVRPGSGAVVCPHCSTYQEVGGQPELPAAQATG